LSDSFYEYQLKLWLLTNKVLVFVFSFHLYPEKTERKQQTNPSIDLQMKTAIRRISINV